MLWNLSSAPFWRAFREQYEPVARGFPPARAAESDWRRPRRCPEHGRPAGVRCSRRPGSLRPPMSPPASVWLSRPETASRPSLTGKKWSCSRSLIGSSRQPSCQGSAWLQMAAQQKQVLPKQAPKVARETTAIIYGAGLRQLYKMTENDGVRGSRHNQKEDKR